MFLGRYFLIMLRKAQIIKKYLPIMNQLINKYLQSMDFFVSFTLDEEFNETVKSRHRDTFSYNSFSEGEKDENRFSTSIYMPLQNEK